MADNPPHVGSLLLGTAWIVQGLSALPPALFLGAFAFNEVLYPYDTVYDFLTFSITACMAVAIIFTVEVQRRITLAATTPSQTLAFEATKALLASAMWAWLMADSALKDRGYYQNGGRAARVQRALIASVVLFVLYYPTVVYAWFVWRRDKGVERAAAEEESVDERTPLTRAQA